MSGSTTTAGRPTQGFQKATKYQQKLRLALFGPSGSGKTMTALRMAAGMGAAKIGLIDSEHGSASKYADRFDFETLILDDDKSIAAYLAAIDMAREAGIDVLLIDSGTHAWHELLDEVDVLAKKYGGNKFAAWAEGTPKQKAFVDAITGYPGHVIMTMRSKTAWEIQTDDKGKKKPVKIGLTPEQRSGVEYEFDMLIEMDLEHSGRVDKDRTGKFQDKTIKKPDEKFGKALADWLNEGEAPPPKPERKPAAAAVPAAKPKAQQAEPATLTGKDGWKVAGETNVEIPELARLLGLNVRAMREMWQAAGENPAELITILRAELEPDPADQAEPEMSDEELPF